MYNIRMYSYNCIIYKYLSVYCMVPRTVCIFIAILVYILHTVLYKLHI